MDSLSVVTGSGTRAVRLASVDTLWIRRQKHDGLLAGAGFGALMFALLQIGRGSGDRETAARMGATIFLGATTTGILIDAVSNRWSQRYPPK